MFSIESGLGMRRVAANAKSEQRLALPFQTMWLALLTRSYRELAGLRQDCVRLEVINQEMEFPVRINKFTYLRANLEHDDQF